MISDDQSSVHTSFAGAPELSTSGFDRLANQAAYFTHSFTTVASCTPSRFLPDNKTIRNDIADYFFEIQWADNHLVKALNYLEETGQLNNTIIVYTSDNGMSFPRARATSYNYNIQMPLAMMWGDKIKPGRLIEDFVNHVDFAPTFLDAAGVDIPAELSGKSLLPILLSEESGLVDPNRTFTLTGFERHV